MKRGIKITTLFLDIGGVIFSDGWRHEFRQQAAEKFDLDYAEMNSPSQIAVSCV